MGDRVTVGFPSDSAVFKPHLLQENCGVDGLPTTGRAVLRIADACHYFCSIVCCLWRMPAGFAHEFPSLGDPEIVSRMATFWCRIGGLLDAILYADTCRILPARQ